MFLIDIDHVQIAAPKGCEPAARNYFHALLGLEELEKPASLAGRGGCWFRIGPRQLHVGVEEPFHPAAKAHPAFLVRDIKHLFQVLEAAGHPCTWDDLIEGVTRFHTRDPWGNRMEFTEPTDAG